MLRRHLFVPDDYFQGSVEDFWRRLPELDANFEQRRQLLAEEGKRWRFVATMEHGKTNVALKRWILTILSIILKVLIT